MNFQPELAEKVVRGEKTVTRRLCNDNPRSPWWTEQCGYQPGGGPNGGYAVTRGRGKGPAIGRVEILAVARVQLGHLTVEEARAEGFASVEAFEEAWAVINGAYDGDAVVWRIEMRVVRA